MKTINILALFSFLLTFLPATFATPIPDTDIVTGSDASPNNVTLYNGNTADGLGTGWYLWCGSDESSAGCMSKPYSYQCDPKSGAPSRKKVFGKCDKYCTCIPACTVVGAGLGSMPLCGKPVGIYGGSMSVKAEGGSESEAETASGTVLGVYDGKNNMVGTIGGTAANATTNEAAADTALDTATLEPTDKNVFAVAANTARDDTSLNSTDVAMLDGPVDNALSTYKIWCGYQLQTNRCSNYPWNYGCRPSGAPYFGTKSTSCHASCRCLPQCTYEKIVLHIGPALYCLKGGGVKKSAVLDMEGNVVGNGTAGDSVAEI